MAEERPDLRALSKLLTGAGIAWLVLFIVANSGRAGGTPLGDALGFFGESVFVPFALVLGGRAVGRRAKRDETAAALKPKQAPHAPAPPRAADASGPSSSKAAGGLDELAGVFGLEAEALEPGPPEAPTVSPVTDAEKPTARHLGAPQRPQPSAAAAEEPTHKPKTSGEMIAEARERLAARPKPPG